ncbi:MAG: hypothetical protein U0836_16315 [Pirellulales bacterium]
MSESPAPLFKLDHESFRYLLWEPGEAAYWITESGEKGATRQEVDEVRHRLEEVQNGWDYIPAGLYRWWNPRLYRVLRDWDRTKPP